jgi:hypothetical protein
MFRGHCHVFYIQISKFFPVFEIVMFKYNCHTWLGPLFIFMAFSIFHVCHRLNLPLMWGDQSGRGKGWGWEREGGWHLTSAVSTKQGKPWLNETNQSNKGGKPGRQKRPICTRLIGGGRVCLGIAARYRLPCLLPLPHPKSAPPLSPSPCRRV